MVSLCMTHLIRAAKIREVPEVPRVVVLLHYQGHNNMTLEDNKMIYPQQL